MVRNRRGTAQHLTGRHIPNHTRLPRNHGIVADRNMVNDRHLPAYCYMSPQPRTSRNAGLCNNDAVLADLTVVGHLHKIVYFSASTNTGSFQCGSVNGDIGAELHIVLNDNYADLRDLEPRRSVWRITKAITANDSAVMYDNSVPIRHPSRTETPA